MRLVDREDAQALPGLPEELRVAMTEVAGAAREGLLAMSVAVGLQVLAELWRPRSRPRPAPGMPSSPAASPAAMAPPPARWCSAAGESRWTDPGPAPWTATRCSCTSWQAFSDDDLLGRVVVERMLAGLATRRHQAAAEPVGSKINQTARATSKSAVSRRFVAATRKALGASCPGIWPSSRWLR